MARFAGSHVLSMAQYDRTDLEALFAAADEARTYLAAGHPHRPLAGRVLASAFFERSTRTRLAHEVAMSRLGGSVTGFAEPSVTRAGGITQESHEDIARMLSLFGDVAVVRHPVTGWPAQAAAKSAGALFINGGDGVGEHPTQAMVDLYTLRRRFGRLDGLRILLVNDLRMRCVRSLLLGLRHFDCKVYGVGADGAGPDVPTAPEVSMHDSMRELLPEVDVVYSSPTVAQDPDGARRDAGRLRRVTVNRGLLDSSGNKHLTVLHPLPRGTEVAADVDDSPFNGYWEQAGNGVPVRMALLKLMFEAEQPLSLSGPHTVTGPHTVSGGAHGTAGIRPSSAGFRSRAEEAPGPDRSAFPDGDGQLLQPLSPVLLARLPARGRAVDERRSALGVRYGPHGRTR